MMLFQVIQECVDLIYFLEEDTISTANGLLDNIILAEVKEVAEHSSRISLANSLVPQ